MSNNHCISFSIIIPTLNEEKNIATVISQFKALDGAFRYEVLVGDGGSTDRTIEIAGQLGAVVIPDTTGNNTIASGRDEAAKAASGDIFIFCDADTRLSDVLTLAEEIEIVFQDNDVVGAMPRMEVFPEEQLLRDKIFHSGYNVLVRFFFWIGFPVARGQCQIVRASAFRQVGGFNQKQIHAEDSSLYNHLSKIGKLKFINMVTVYESPRRYRKYGYWQVAFLGVYSIIGQAIFGRNILRRWDRVD
jgi:glycosyltransferase involved in cell wall biosynthesis